VSNGSAKNRDIFSIELDRQGKGHRRNDFDWIDESLKCTFPLRSFRHYVSSGFLEREVTGDRMRLLEDQVDEVKEGAFRIASRKENVGIEKNPSQDLDFPSLRRSPISSEANSAILFSEYISIGTLTAGRRRIPSGVCSAIK